MDGYIVDDEYDEDVVISNSDKSVSFIIQKKNNELVKLYTDKFEELFIPHIFPSGHKIDCTGYNFLNGNPSRVVFDDEIKIGSCSFNSNKKFRGEVVWPTNCQIIPRQCFYESSVTKVSNIEKVKAVEEYAFTYSSIEEILWPDNCKTIPESCFAYCSYLQKIEMKNVEEIQCNAFYNSGITEIRWPNKCKIIPELCFASSRLEKIEGLQNIETIKKKAFSSTRLKYLDLSESSIAFLEDGSLSFLPRQCKIIFPYYISEDDFLAAFV